LGFFNDKPVFIGYYCVFDTFLGFSGVFGFFGFFGFLGFLTLESAFQSMLERSQRISAFVKIDFGQCWRPLPNVDMPEEILLPSQRWRKQGGHSAMLLPVARG